MLFVDLSTNELLSNVTLATAIGAVGATSQGVLYAVGLTNSTVMMYAVSATSGIMRFHWMASPPSPSAC